MKLNSKPSFYTGFLKQQALGVTVKVKNQVKAGSKNLVALNNLIRLMAGYEVINSYQDLLRINYYLHFADNSVLTQLLK